jgi:ankyrin repeat protein
MADKNTKKLWKSARDGNLAEVARLLGLGGVNINWVNEDAQGETPLIVATRNDRLEVVRTLLDAGADVNHRNEGDTTAIYWAAFKGNEDMINLLLERGADANIAGRDGSTPLNIAKLKGNTPAVFLLLDALGDYNQTDAEGKTLLHWASSRGKIPLINFLLEKGVDVNQKDKKGKTAISLAKNEDIRKLLQESGKLSGDAAEGLKRRKHKKTYKRKIMKKGRKTNKNRK